MSWKEMLPAKINMMAEMIQDLGPEVYKRNIKKKGLVQEISITYMLNFSIFVAN